MKINILKEKLKEILQIVTNVCSQKTDLSILNYFYLSAKNQEIYVSATDLELNYQTKFLTQVLKEGEVLIPARQFEKIIDNFYEDEVSLEIRDTVLEIRGKNSVSTLPGLSYEEFPTFTEINFTKYFEIDNEIFQEYLNRLSPILTTSDIRPEYSGIYFDLNGENLNLVATDTIRLGIQKVKSQFFDTNIEKISVLLPKRLIQEYQRIKRKSGKLKIYFEENQVTFEILNHLLTAKLLALEYPNYQQFIAPASFLFTFLLDKNQILQALKLARVFLDQFKETELIFNFKDNQLEIYTHNELLGENRNKLEFEVKENNLTETEFKIKFHLDFLYDGLAVIESEKIFGGFFTGLNASTPLYLKSPIEEDFVYILVHR
ncbi:MAG: DNA polymerase III subunit beta [Candidatus Parcubacteria bacterium]|nr:MAG: DNA polymerase III subunit beta [Candidatus Parcubacteria bacterium]